MYFQKTMFVANPGPHQHPVDVRHSNARPVQVIHPASGSTPGPVQSGSHERVIASAQHAPARVVHRGGPVVQKPKIHPPHPQSRLAR